MAQIPPANIRHLNPWDFPPLHEAAYYGKTECVEALIANDANPNEKYGRGGFTPLHLAASEGHTETVQALIKLCADIDVTDGFGYTPLRLADENGHAKTAKVLRDAMERRR